MTKKYKELGLKYIFTVQPKEFCVAISDPKTEKEKTVKYYEKISPFVLLNERSGGADIPLADLKMIESLMKEYRLNSGVINCLIDFVLYTNDFKLPKAYLAKIAGHWSRKGIKTVPQAMEMALSEREKRKSTNKQDDILHKLLARNEQLEKRVEELEKRLEMLERDIKSQQS